MTLHKKWSFPLRISSINVTKSAGNCELVIFTEEILNGKLGFLCSVRVHVSYVVNWKTVLFEWIQSVNNLYFFTFAKNENHVRKTYRTKFEKFLVEKLKIIFWGVTFEVVTANRLKRDKKNWLKEKTFCTSSKRNIIYHRLFVGFYTKYIIDY